ncbi:MAG: diaminopropionate ammonia-lyase [Magnetospiraceae bacterium]
MVQVSLHRFLANAAAQPTCNTFPFAGDGLDVVRRVIQAWPGYAPTPLRSLAELARDLELGSIHFKDEGRRFGLGSFKPLGGAFAVHQFLARMVTQKTGDPDPDLLSGNYADIVSTYTVTAATDGNHGRAVAWGAKLFGCQCVIYINAAATQGRADAIASQGAEVRRVDGSYDAAVRIAAAAGEQNGWQTIADTSDGRSLEAPRDVTQGYMLMADEALAQWPEAVPPTHTFLQAGVGGMAAASCARLCMAFEDYKPKTIIVEPDQAACWYASLDAGKPVAVTGDIDSEMAGLACGEVSHIAWGVLYRGADFAVTVDDAAVPEVMRYLAQSGQDDRPIVAGESGIAGLAGLIATATDAQARTALGLGPDSHILLFGSEGATDPVNYEAIVGKSPAEVAA